MAITSITDLAPLVNQKAFADAVQQEIKEKSKFIKAGIAVSDPIIAAKCAQGGKTVELPFFNALGGTSVLDEETLEEGTEATIDALTMGLDEAVKTVRVKAWGATDLATILSGADPLAVIKSQIAEWKIRAAERKLFATLEGIFGVSGMDALTLDLTKATGDDQYLTKHTFGRAAQLLGEHKVDLTTIVCNSEVEQYLQEADTEARLYVPSQVTSTLASYGGRELITDDQAKCTYDSDSKSSVAEIYLFGKGAIAYNDCPVNHAFEVARDAIKSQDYIVTRTADIMHVRGVKWVGTTFAQGTSSTPKNADLATASNWSMVYPKDYIRCVKIIARIK